VSSNLRSVADNIEGAVQFAKDICLGVRGQEGDQTRQRWRCNEFRLNHVNRPFSINGPVFENPRFQREAHSTGRVSSQSVNLGSVFSGRLPSPFKRRFRARAAEGARGVNERVCGPCHENRQGTRCMGSAFQARRSLCSTRAPRLTNFETIHNPELVTGTTGERPTDFPPSY
jgi:hypothetical protein